MKLFRLILLFFFIAFPFQSARADTDCEMDTPCSEDVSDLKAFTVTEISYEEMVRLYESKEAYFLVDVRPQQNYEYEHIKGALSLFVVQANAQKINEFLPDKNAKIVVYCSSRSCPMSYHAAQHLQKLGYTNVLNYKGGIGEWRLFKQPTERTTIQESPTAP
ncbi:MAG: rhodanese-like domain-containing protein [Candidatus Omnitrophota bacterium]